MLPMGACLNWRRLALACGLALIVCPAIAQSSKPDPWEKFQTPPKTNSADAFYDPEPQKKWNEYVMFHRKVFTDTGEVVIVSGGLTGEGLGYPNNIITLECFKSSNTCIAAQTEEFGSKQVGDIRLNHYDVSVWSSSTIAVTDVEMCATLNITINRQTKDVSFITTPGGFASKSEICTERPDNKTYFWRLTDPLSAQKLDRAR